MAVAVKSTPETAPHRPLDHLAVNILLGTAYVLGSIWAVFYGLRQLGSFLLNQLGLEWSAVSVSLLILAMVVLAAGLLVLGLRLAGPHPRPGMRAGMVVGIMTLIVIGFITSAVGSAIADGFGRGNQGLGIGITGAVGTLLLVGVGRLFMGPQCERVLVHIEHQGWFNILPYKRSQGQRVRRGSMLGILVLAGCGIVTMLNHHLLDNGPKNWQILIPFTDRVVEEHALPDGEGVAWTAVYQAVVLLPDVRFTLPIVLALLALWLAYRVVNLPVFADFLIATEAELNKVSWTTRRRLVQDTVVVLVTVLLLTTFLFLADQLWGHVLTRIGVLKISTTEQKNESKLHW